MTGFTADVLVAWLVVTSACSALLAVVVAGQGALARVRRRACRRRTLQSPLRAAPARSAVSRADGTPAPR